MCSEAGETTITTSIQITARFTIISGTEDRQFGDPARARVRRGGSRVRISGFLPSHEIVENQPNIIVIVIILIVFDVTTPCNFATFDIVSIIIIITQYCRVIVALGAPLLQKYPTENPLVSRLRRALHREIQLLLKKRKRQYATCQDACLLKLNKSDT